MQCTGTLSIQLPTKHLPSPTDINGKIPIDSKGAMISLPVFVYITMGLHFPNRYMLKNAPEKYAHGHLSEGSGTDHWRRQDTGLDGQQIWSTRAIPRFLCTQLPYQAQMEKSGHDMNVVRVISLPQFCHMPLVKHTEEAPVPCIWCIIWNKRAKRN